jgi:hypothetical protein
MAGLVSTGFMVLFELPFWRAFGIKAVLEWQVNQIIVTRLLKEEYNESRRLRPALAMHLLHGTVAGSVLLSY